MLRQAQRLFKPFDTRTPAFLAGFRPSEGQSLRASLDLGFLPLLQQFFGVDKSLVGSERWGEEYYRFLTNHSGCLGYGGYYGQDLLKNPWFQNIEPLNSFLKMVTWHHDTVVLRWDSWRFWESMAFGCVTVHLDFERYGFSLPVLPENWNHYIGIRLDHIKEDVERINDERHRLPEIAQADREWAIHHYSPVAVARRFIGDVKQLFNPDSLAMPAHKPAPDPA